MFSFHYDKKEYYNYYYFIVTVVLLFIFFKKGVSYVLGCFNIALIYCMFGLWWKDLASTEISYLLGYA